MNTSEAPNAPFKGSLQEQDTDFVVNAYPASGDVFEPTKRRGDRGIRVFQKAYSWIG